MKKIDIVDHRSIGINIDPGGTRRLFEIASLPPDDNLRVRVVDSFGHGATVEQLYSAESLVKVTHDYGGQFFYDYLGHLQRVIIPVAAFCFDLSDEILGLMDEGMLEAMGSILEIDTDLLVEVDLRDGITQGDGSGWVQLICGSKGMVRVDAGIGGFEIGPNIKMELHSVLLIDRNNIPLGRVFVKVEVRGDELYLALGDGRIMVSLRFFRQIDSSLVAGIDNPVGTFEFLTSLVSNPG